ncbi:MAG TPA: hypothetical protein VFQ60_01775, partial [Patescibacteria group bacterium]|nr:hypothetical protein [Patescibacteria group bacterium]
MTLWKLKFRLRSMSRESAPDKGFVSELRKKLFEGHPTAQPSRAFFIFTWQRTVVALSLLLSLAIG